MKSCHAIDLGVMSYHDAFALQKRDVARRQAGEGEDVLYFVEHPHVITLGRNATGAAVLSDDALLKARGIAVTETDRGGDATYHGPGQLVGYPILALENDRRDIRRYVSDLEEVLIRTLSDFGIDAARHDEYRGVWVGGKKIASLGVRVARWVTCHGFALNVNTDLSYFSTMHPCGIVGCRMTSMESMLGSPVSIDAVKQSVVIHFSQVFNRRLVERTHVS